MHDILGTALELGHLVAECAVAALNHVEFVLNLGTQTLEFGFLTSHQGAFAGHGDFHLAHLPFEGILVVAELLTFVFERFTFLSDLGAFLFEFIGPFLQLGAGFRGGLGLLWPQLARGNLLLD